MACRILIPQPGIEPEPPTVEVQSSTHWIARELPEIYLLNIDPRYVFKQCWISLLTQDGEESACNVGDLGSIPGLGRSPGRGHGNPTPVFLPGEFHGQRSLVSYSPWGHKESDMTE